MSVGKCPHCDKLLTHAIIESADIWEGTVPAMTGKRIFKGAIYSCPSCHAVLSVGLDPLAVTNDIADAVIERLRKGS
jgi:hypothetical protein